MLADRNSSCAARRRNGGAWLGRHPLLRRLLLAVTLPLCAHGFGVGAEGIGFFPRLGEKVAAGVIVATERGIVATERVIFRFTLLDFSIRSEEHTSELQSLMRIS